MKNPFLDIQKEIEKYPIEIFVEFMKFFPCKRKNYFIPIKKEKDNIKIIIKGRQVGPTIPIYSATYNVKYLTLPNKKNMYVICASAQDFWERWNRFKKIKVFL